MYIQSKKPKIARVPLLTFLLLIIFSTLAFLGWWCYNTSMKKSLLGFKRLQIASKLLVVLGWKTDSKTFFPVPTEHKNIMSSTALKTYHLTCKKISHCKCLHKERKIKNDFDFSSHFCSKKSNFHVKPKIIPLSTICTLLLLLSTRTHYKDMVVTIKSSLNIFPKICIIKICFKFVADSALVRDHLFSKVLNYGLLSPCNHSLAHLKDFCSWIKKNYIIKVSEK